jgi:hypothetical protein
MADADYIALIHAELDKELEASQRAELARRLLSDPEARELREDLLRLRTLLETVEDVEPPNDLRAKILQALPVATGLPGRFGSPAQRWRYAALAAGVVAAATLVYETAYSPGPGSTEAVGTIAARRSPPTLDTVALRDGPVTGRVSLYRDGDQLGLSFDLVAGAPVDVLIASDGQTLRIGGLGHGSLANQKTTVALPGSQSGSRHTVDLTFLMSGQEVGRATLTAPEDH